MGIVGKFIDQVCETHPHLMRAVLERPLAPLYEWIDWDNANGPCGCLIGTMALAAGVTPAVYCECDYLSGVIGWYWDDIVEVGGRVNDISCRIAWGKSQRTSGTTESDAYTVHLLRQRIARQLAIREARFATDVRLPNEPVEPVALRATHPAGARAP